MDAPVACSLEPAAARAQLDEWQALFVVHAVRVERPEPTQLVLHLRSDSGVLPKLVELTKREAACCPFFEFSMTVDPDVVTLSIGVPADAQPVLDELAALVARP